MRNLNYELKQLCNRNRDGSYATQHDRERVLDQIADQLQELGFRHVVVAGPETEARRWIGRALES
jgi:hypothetical protein